MCSTVQERNLEKRVYRETLVAPDISCEQCQRAIEGALGQLAGVSNARVDIPSKTVQITYDPEQVTLAKIEEVLDDTGYTVAK